MKPFNFLRSLLISLVTLAVFATPSMAKRVSVRCSYQQNLSSLPIIQCNPSTAPALTGATDTMVTALMDTVKPAFFTTPQLAFVKAPAGSGEVITQTATPATKWPDSIIANVTVSMDTNKTITLTWQHSSVASPTLGKPSWTNMATASNISATTTQSSFRLATPFIPGVPFRILLLGSGLATMTVQNLIVWAK
jgi:hypothetical protein